MGFLKKIKRVPHTHTRPKRQEKGHRGERSRREKCRRWARGPGGAMPGREYFLIYTTTGHGGDGVGFFRFS